MPADKRKAELLVQQLDFNLRNVRTKMTTRISVGGKAPIRSAESLADDYM